ncbi:AfsR/SARP family transcriptional regulator [Streptomyces sp. NPDC055078]
MRFSVLGTTQALHDDGTPVALGGARLRALLTVLALRPGRPVPVGVLVDEVWDGDPPVDAVGAVQALVGRLRKALGRDAVASADGGGYRLRADGDAVDLHRFDRLAGEGARALEQGDAAKATALLEDALALWRGPVLADLPNRAAEVSRWEARRLDARRTRLAAMLALRRAEDALPELAALCGEHPIDESLQVLRLRALRDTGRPAEALAAYETFRRRLADRLGTDPGPALRGLHMSLLTDGTAVLTDGPGPGPAGGGEPTAPQSLRPPGSPQPPQSPPAGTAHAATAHAATAHTGTADDVPGGRAHGRGTAPVAPDGFTGGAAGDGGAPAPMPAPPAPAPASVPVPGRPGSVGGTGFAQDAPPGPRDGRPADAGPGWGQPDPHPAPGADRAHPAARAARAARGNVRARLTSFVGRERDLDTIGQDLGGARLVTLLGPGGAGKTRLSQEVAERAANGLPGGVWLAELAPVDDPDDVPEAVLTALGARETVLRGAGAEELRVAERYTDDPFVRLVEHCARRRMLLILDNCEHVIGAAAALAQGLLERCPGLTVLATSREPLGVPGELVRPVDPLPGPVALRLLGERGAAARAGFGVGDDPEACAEICRRLDGLPLAIELAAARLRMLTPRQIADRLDDRFRLLTSGSRTALPRQQTLRAVVDWSWDLLDEDERTLLRALSVFAGGWDLPAAEAVGDAALLGALVDKSLVTAAPDAEGCMRFRLLETIGEYAAERAAEVPAARETAARAHTEYFAAFVEEAEPRLRSADQLPWITRIEADLDNIRAALHRTAVAAPDEASALRLVFGMGWFWWLRNYRAEGLSWAERVLALGPGPAEDGDPPDWPRMHLRVLHFFLALESRPADRVREDAGLMSTLRGIRRVFEQPGPEAARFPGLLWPLTACLTEDMAEVRGMLDAAVANTRKYGSDWEYGTTLLFRTHMVIDMSGGVDGVDEDLTELLRLSRRVGDRWLRAQTASAAGEAGMRRGRFPEAKEAYAEALALVREVGAHAESPFLQARLAELAFHTGDTAGAERRLDEAGREADRNDSRDADAYIHIMRAGLAMRRGERAEARRLTDEARRLSGLGSPPVHFEVFIDGIDATLTAHEAPGPSAAVVGLAAALRKAWAADCAEYVSAQLADSAAAVLPLTGRLALSVRLLAAADAWRGSAPRSAPEAATADGLRRRARLELGPRHYDAEHTAGLALTVPEAAELLEAVAGPGPAAGG